MSKWKTTAIIFIVLFIIIIPIQTTVIVWQTIASNNLRGLERENHILKRIMKADIDLMMVGQDETRADEYYSSAGFSYEEQDFKGVERNCKVARNYYGKSAQGYREIRADLNEDKEHKLVEIYIKMLDELIIIENSMFEACEYFESASRYYDKYYNEIDYSEVDYDMASQEIDGMNEKIETHDNAVERYNTLLAEFNEELEGMINKKK